MNNPSPRMASTNSEVFFLALVKGDERFVWIFPPTVTGADQALRSVRQMASDPSIDFSWYDAAMMMKKIHEEFKQE